MFLPCGGVNFCFFCRTGTIGFFENLLGVLNISILFKMTVRAILYFSKSVLNHELTKTRMNHFVVLSDIYLVGFE